MSKEKLEFMGFPIEIETRRSYFFKRLQFWKWKKIANGMLVDRRNLR